MTYLDRAIKDGYAIITGPENKQKIIYVTSDNHTENYNDPEEKVRAEFWAELIYEYDYPAHRIKVEVTIPDRVPTDRADIVIFSDDECKKPYAVVECKRDGVTDAEFLQAIEQGVGNATWVKLRASYVVIIAGATRRVLDFSDDSTGILERENNIIADLPKAYGKPQAFRFYRGGEYTDVDGKKKKAPDIQPVAREDLITAIKKCHNTLWGGGRLSPPTAFGELCKLIFVKISDEQKPRKKGEPYQFQIKTHEPSSKLAERINALYNEQKVKDPEVFTDSIKVDDRVLRTVVSHLESINLNKTDLDVKGVAFEQFMDGFFKGDFGQYFTPRPIIEFAVKMMKPEHDWDVLDPACGSGGFLLHALDYMRSQASEYYDKDTVDYFNYWHDFASKHLYGIEINDEIARVAKMNMNSLFKNIQINQLSGRLRQIAGTPNVLSMQFSAVDVAGIRESIITIANECKADDPQIARQLLAAKDILFAVNQFGQAFINPYAIGEILFGLDYLAAKGQAPSAEKQTTAEIWSYIHPLIQKSSKKLFEDGHFANAAEDAFIELNSRAKAIYKKLVPSAATVPDGTDLMHKLFGSNPLLCPVRDTGTESGNNYQQGFHFMTAGAMSALRNPKAHSNDEVLTAEEALRRLMFASMLMYKLDEAGL